MAKPYNAEALAGLPDSPGLLKAKAERKLAAQSLQKFDASPTPPWTWGGQVADIEGASPHLVLVRWVDGRHENAVGPEASVENQSQRHWSDEEVAAIAESIGRTIIET